MATNRHHKLADLSTAREYGRAWQDKMVEIWTDRITLLGAVDTGRLRQSVKKQGFSFTAARASIDFAFVTYGLYVDAGVGKEIYRGNSGDLDIKNKAYRQAHGYKSTGREPRPWFSRSWAISREIFKNKMAQIAGESFAGAFDELT